MGTSNVERVNSSGTGDEAHGLSSHEPENVNCATSGSSTPEEVARQIKAATDPLIRQLKRLCALMKELRQAPQKSQIGKLPMAIKTKECINLFLYKVR